MSETKPTAANEVLTPEPERWERELREAGWKPYMFRGHERRNMWVSPQGTMHLGPYGAWRLMQSMKQWPSSEEKQ